MTASRRAVDLALCFNGRGLQRTRRETRHGGAFGDTQAGGGDGRCASRARSRSEERLYRVNRFDIESGALPAGALLPSSGVRNALAQELALQETEVQSALARLLIEGLLAVRDGGQICIANQGQAKTVGDDTQRRFEASLFKAMREAQARGLSSTEASGMFKAALQRLGGDRAGQATESRQRRRRRPGGLTSVSGSWEPRRRLFNAAGQGRRNPHWQPCTGLAANVA